MSLLSRLFGREKKGETDTVAPSAPAADERHRPHHREVYCAAPSQVVPAGLTRMLVTPLASRQAFLLPAPDADLLIRCADFKTLDEHAHHLCQAFRLDSVRFDSILEQLESFAEQGLLLAMSEFDRRGTHPLPAVVQPRIHSVGMITKDRGSIAERGLTSHMDNCRKYDRRVEWVLFDDSPAPETWVSHRRMLSSLKKEYGVAVCYAGPLEKRAYAEALVGQGCPADAVNFALLGSPQCGKTVGANRNALLLQNVGELVLSVDDDILGRLCRVPGARDGMNLTSLADPTEFWIFKDQTGLVEAIEPIDEDILALHEHMLGSSLTDCISRVPPQEHLGIDQAKDDFRSLIQGGRGTVASTSLGLAGDVATATTRGYLFLREASLERLTSSQPDYPALALSRKAMRGVTRPTVSNGNFLMSPSLGLDVRQLLPPFFPVLQNSEGVFSQALRVCNPQAYYGFLPYLVPHEPPQVRTGTKEANLLSGRTVLLEGIVRICLSSHEPMSRHTEPMRRMRSVGEHLCWLGRLAPREFEEFLRLAVFRVIGASTTYLEQSLKLANEQPECWADDVHEFIGAVHSGIHDPDLVVPRDLAEGRSREEALGLAQHLIGQYGALLVSWPDVLDACRTLLNRGIRLAPAVSSDSP